MGTGIEFDPDAPVEVDVGPPGRPGFEGPNPLWGRCELRVNDQQSSEQETYRAAASASASASLTFLNSSLLSSAVWSSLAYQ